MDLKPSKADPDIWMRSCKNHTLYEYIAVCVDDLASCMKDTQAFCDTLKEVCKLKLKGVGPLGYHLGCGYSRDEDGIPVAYPRNMLTRFFNPMKKCLGRNQRRPEHHQEEITQKLIYLSSVIKTKSNSTKQSLDS